MTLPIKSITSCLVILATASNIHAEEIRKFESPKQLAVVPKGKEVMLGSGVEPSQLPIAVYSSNLNNLYVSVYIIQGKKKCSITFSGRSGSTVDVENIKQLADNRIAFIWNELVSLYRKSWTAATTISILDTDACANKNNVKFTWAVPSTNSLEVVPFVHGFDVIASTNSHTRYDTDGNQIGKSESFLINSSVFVVSPVSEKSPYGGFFIVDYIHVMVNLVKANGELEKQLLDNINVEVFTNNEQSLYSVCSFDTHIVDLVYCYLYDEGGNKKWNNQVKLGYPGVLDVKNLANGGLVFAALNYAGNQVYIVEMGPTQVKTWSYSPKQKFTRVRLMEFNEKEHTFALAYGARQVVQGVLQESFELQKYVITSP